MTEFVLTETLTVVIFEEMDEKNFLVQLEKKDQRPFRLLHNEMSALLHHLHFSFEPHPQLHAWLIYQRPTSSCGCQKEDLMLHDGALWQENSFYFLQMSEEDRKALCAMEDRIETEMSEVDPIPQDYDDTGSCFKCASHSQYH